jgi:hypothetical protein
MKPANLLFILCDEHNPRVLRCAGHPMIRGFGYSPTPGTKPVYN